MDKRNFVTNMDIDMLTTRKLGRIYSKRWGIETSYRVKKEFRPTTTVILVPTVKLEKNPSINASWQAMPITGGQMSICIPPKWTISTFNRSQYAESPDQTSSIFAKSGINYGTDSMKNEFDQRYIDNDMLQSLIANFTPSDVNVSIDPTYYVISGHPSRKIEWDESPRLLKHTAVYEYTLRNHNEAYIIVQDNDSLTIVLTKIQLLASDEDRILAEESLESVTG
jgi:hypothetical protein